MDGIQKSPTLKTPYTEKPTMFRDRKSKFNPITLKLKSLFTKRLFSGYGIPMRRLSNVWVGPLGSGTRKKFTG